MSGRRAVFLDKDGTLIENVPYNADPAHIRLLPGAAEGLRRLHDAAYLLVVVSNQSGVAHGYFAEPALLAVEERLRRLLLESGIPLSGFYYCPHHPEGRVRTYAVPCHCRKPEPGLIRRAAAELGIDVSASWLVGDILNDVEAGNRVGCRTVLIDNGGETEWVGGPMRTPDMIAFDLAQAAAHIIETDSPAVVPAGAAREAG